jgi:hypothetical protein
MKVLGFANQSNCSGNFVRSGESLLILSIMFPLTHVARCVVEKGTSLAAGTLAGTLAGTCKYVHV